MNVLFEESGSFKAGTVLADNHTSLQVELPGGRRCKIKADHVLLKFSVPSANELLAASAQMSAQIDASFLWETCSPEEFFFLQCAEEYFGHTPSSEEAVSILLSLQQAPIYFHRKGKGRFRKAPPEILQAALSGLEKKRQQQEHMDRLCSALRARQLPDELSSCLEMLLYKADRNRIESKALEHVAHEEKILPLQLLAQCGALPSPHHYHLQRFLFEHFPQGISHQDPSMPLASVTLPRAKVAAFSIDDAYTTEIDDAFSVSPKPEGGWRIGIHIAAPGLGFGPESPLNETCRKHLSTVYIPGKKFTMLPDGVIELFTLREQCWRPALSLYVDVTTDLHMSPTQTVIEEIFIEKNLRHQDLPQTDEDLLNSPDTSPCIEALKVLWPIAQKLAQARGAHPAKKTHEFSFHVDWDQEAVEIIKRQRDAPLDVLVAEWMIFTNAHWGKLLDEHKIPAIYRSQQGGKVRMSTQALPHEALGVSCYAWCSSPLRRYVDLINQWQLLALQQSHPPLARNTQFLADLHAFEIAHQAYQTFQRHMEHYWCLRFIQQQGAHHPFAAKVIRENLVRLEDMPLITRCLNLPENLSTAEQRLSVHFAHIDLLTLETQCHYLHALPEETSTST